MKWTKVIGLVIFMHLFVISVLLINPGCNRLSSKDTSRANVEVSSGDQLHSSYYSTSQESRRSAPTRPEKAIRLIDEENGDESLSSIGFEESTEAFNAVQTVSRFIYTVVKGDTLSGIAKKYGVSLEALFQTNGLKRNSTLAIGQKIVIPQINSTMPFSVPIATTTLSATLVPAEAGIVYRVREGDTLSEIAQYYGMSTAALKTANRLSSDRIRIGQELVIPGNLDRSDSPASTTRIVTRNEPSLPDDNEGYSHVVRAGETPGEIAQRYGMRTQELMALNNIADPRKLRVGTRLALRHRQEVEGETVGPEAVMEPGSTPPETAEYTSQSYSKPISTLPESRPVPEEVLFEEIDAIPIISIETVESE